MPTSSTAQTRSSHRPSSSSTRAIRPGASRGHHETRRSQPGVGQRLITWLETTLGRRIEISGHGMRTRVALKKLSSNSVISLLPGMVELKPLSQNRLDRMRTDLRRLLRQHPQTKTLLRHLAFVERTLRKQGLDAVDQLPLDVLHKALNQLESIVINWSAHGLGEARSRLAILIRNKEIESQHFGASVQPTELGGSMNADVCEVSHSVFEEMDRSWRGQMPPSMTAASVH